MKIEVLLSIMNNNDIAGIYKAINAHTDLLIINQCKKNAYDSKMIDNNLVRLFSFNEKGVGLSRNSALMRSSGDICLMADDDIKYLDEYEKIVLNEYKKHPNADMIVFNVPSLNENRNTKMITKFKRLRFYNCFKFGTYSFSFKKEKVYQSNIYFSLLFGGGAKYGSGEDSKFIYDCIKKGLRVYASPQTIGFVKQDSSTWFNGYTEKYFFDKGALYGNIFKKFGKLFCLQFLLRHRDIYKTIGFKTAFNNMLRGVNEINGKRIS